MIVLYMSHIKDKNLEAGGMRSLNLLVPVFSSFSFFRKTPPFPN